MVDLKRIVAITGMPGSGKSEVVSILSERFPTIRMGDIVWEYTERKGLPLDPENVGEVADRERKIYGPDIWAMRTIERINLMGGDVIVIDGLRSASELEAFKRVFGQDFILVAVHASPMTRYRRLSERGRRDDWSDTSKTIERDIRELSWGLSVSIALADRMIVNEGTLEDLRDQVDRLAEEIIAQD